MVGSANTTGYGARTQWNDMYTTTEASRSCATSTRRSSSSWSATGSVAEPYVHRTAGDLRERVLPAQRHHRAENDPVMERLDGVRCAATGGTGSQRPHRHPHRDVRLGRRPRPLPRPEGRRPRQERLRRPVLLSAPGPQDRRHPQARWRPGQERRPRPRQQRGHRLRRHAATRCSPTRSTWRSAAATAATMGYQVWTGSENWSGMGMINDEVVIRIPEQQRLHEVRRELRLRVDELLPLAVTGPADRTPRGPFLPHVLALTGNRDRQGTPPCGRLGTPKRGNPSSCAKKIGAVLTHGSHSF